MTIVNVKIICVFKKTVIKKLDTEDKTCAAQYKTMNKNNGLFFKHKKHFPTCQEMLAVFC